MTIAKPEASAPTPKPSASIVMVGPLLLFLLALPLLPSVFIALIRGNLAHFLSCVTAIGLLGLAIKLVRVGQRRQLELRRLNWSRIAPRPWKTAAALSIASAVTLCALVILPLPPWAALCFGTIGAAGSLLNYGLDWPHPLAQKGTTAEDVPPAVAEALDEAHLKIATIDAANQHIQNAELKRRIGRINAKAVGILTLIADDPSTIQRARRFLNVYLDGTQRVTEGYAQVHQKHDSRKLEQNFRNVLITIEDAFERQYHKLQDKEVLDLDVQIEVLRTQLKNEGVR